MDKEIERVLANWIAQALSPDGQLPPDVSRSQWIAAQFLRWWRSDIESHLDESLGDAENSLSSVRAELQRLGGWEKFAEALHECGHLQESLRSLRAMLLPKRSQEDK